MAADTTGPPLAPIVRPNGKVYRPHKIAVQPWDNDTWGRDESCGVVVYGTHDENLAQGLADEEIKRLWDSDWVGINEGCGWFRDSYRHGDRVIADDPVRGRAGVYFRAGYPPSSSVDEGNPDR